MGGRSVAFTPTSEPASDLPALLMVVGALAVVLGLVRFVPRMLVGRAEAAMDAEAYRRAMRLASWVTGGRMRSEAAIIVAISALVLGQHGHARSAIGRLDTREDAAMRQLLLAHMASRQGNLEEAAQRFHKSVELDPAMAPEVHRLLGSAWRRSRTDPTSAYA